MNTPAMTTKLARIKSKPLRYLAAAGITAGIVGPPAAYLYARDKKKNERRSKNFQAWLTHAPEGQRLVRAVQQAKARREEAERVKLSTSGMTTDEAQEILKEAVSRGAIEAAWFSRQLASLGTRRSKGLVSDLKQYRDATNRAFGEGIPRREARRNIKAVKKHFPKGLKVKDSPDFGGRVDQTYRTVAPGRHKAFEQKTLKLVSPAARKKVLAGKDPKLNPKEEARIRSAYKGITDYQGKEDVLLDRIYKKNRKLKGYWEPGMKRRKKMSSDEVRDILKIALLKHAKVEIDPDVVVYKTYHGRWPAAQAGVEALQGAVEGGVIGGAVGTKGGRGRAALAGAGIGAAGGILDAIIERMSERGRQKFLKTREGRKAMKE